jgi:hypothetical protein
MCLMDHIFVKCQVADPAYFSRIVDPAVAHQSEGGHRPSCVLLIMFLSNVKHRPQCVIFVSL